MFNDDLELMHYGTPRHSGRYPWGSGENPYQHASYFMKTVKQLKAEGKTEKEILDILNMSTTEYRARISNSQAELKAARNRQVLKLHDKGYSNVKIAEILETTEGTIRNILKDPLKNREDKNQNTANKLAEVADLKGMIDVTSGIEKVLGVPDTRVKNALAILKDKGYTVTNVYIPQVTDPKKYTTIKVLAKPGISEYEVRKNRLDIQSFLEYHSDDDGTTFYGIQFPKSIDSKRVYIRYGDEIGPDEFQGKDRDGLVQLRPGVEDISLGNSLYSQVRIAVDGSHYMKGMAVYSNDIPEGYDVVYNTNKPLGTDKYKVFKELKKVNKVNEETGEITEVINPDNPFGAIISANGQRWYDDPNGTDVNPTTGQKQSLSVINKVRDEGEWGKWSKSLPSQFLAKQNTTLIKKQLDLAFADKQEEFDEINSLTNDAVKKKLMKSFGDDCDSSAVKLKAAALPRQAIQVILPDPNVPEKEIYAPNYRDGEYVALVRYPHGGTFEIPILKVNNGIKTAKEMLGAGTDNALDAVVINAKTAEQLSGADFDGDTVVVIPTHGSSGVKITSTKPLENLKNFDPKEQYPYYEGMKVISDREMQKQMGIVSNLITDMTLKGASEEELARAVRHSMVVIDSKKHKLNYKQSYIDNRIEQLHIDYQGKPTGGASTIISRAKGTKWINERKEGQYITDPVTGKTKLQYVDPETGKKLYRETGKHNVFYEKDETGKYLVDPETGEKIVESDKARVQKITNMAYYEDAMELVSKEQKPQEILYANYANSLKNLGNQARLVEINTPSVKRDPAAAKEYAPAVESLNAKLETAILNSPKERQAQIIANKVIETNKKLDPSLSTDKDALKKAKSQALASARVKVGASGKESRIHLSDYEWEAIQKGAITNNMLEQILDHMEDSEIKSLAMPRQTTELSDAKQAKIRAMNSSGYSTAEIANLMGVSTSTVTKYIS